jgi:hypothetical protein
VSAAVAELRATLASALSQLAVLESTHIASSSSSSSPSSSSPPSTSIAELSVSRVDLSLQRTPHALFARPFAPSLCAVLAHVTQLSVRHNALTSASVAAIVAAAPHVAVLDVTHNALDSLSPLDRLPLTVLRASHNPLLSPWSLAAVSRLETLALAHCALKGAAVSPAFCGAAVRLRSLDLSANEFDALPSAVSALQTLELLDLSRNRLAELPASLDQCTSLVSISVAHNQLRALPRALATHAELQRRSIRVLLAELPFLHSLAVDGNPLSGASDDNAPRTTDVASLITAAPLPLKSSSGSGVALTAAASAVAAEAKKPAKPIELDPRSAFLPSIDFEVEPFSSMYSEPSKAVIEELSTDTYDYIQFYFNKDHYNFYSTDGKLGPVVVSIRKVLESALAICGGDDTAPVPPGSIGYYRALVRSRKGVERFFIPNTLVDPALIEEALPAAGNVPTGSNGSGNSGSNSSNVTPTLSRESSFTTEQLPRAKSGKKINAKKALEKAESDVGGGGSSGGGSGGGGGGGGSGSGAVSSLLKPSKPLSGAMLTRGLQDLASPLLNDSTFTKVKKADFEKRLVEYENSLIMRGYKFGVLYAAPGQTTEAEILSNRHGSPAFDEFLAFLGNKIQLKGWKKYAGGLDTKSGSTGESAVYTKYAGLEFLFHVANMLPYKEGDEQQLERKRHIGNDVVVIVFQEGDAKLKPDFIRSVFNHIIIIVRPVKLTEEQLQTTIVQPATMPGHQHEPPLNDALLYAEEQQSKATQEAREAIRVRRVTSSDVTVIADASTASSLSGAPSDDGAASADTSPSASLSSSAKQKKKSFRARVIEGKVFYELHVASKLGVGLHRPHLPNPSIFEKGPYFRDFLLTKLINTERSAYKAPGFRTAIERTRRTLLEDLIASVK